MRFICNICGKVVSSKKVIIGSEGSYAGAIEMYCSIKCLKKANEV